MFSLTTPLLCSVPSHASFADCIDHFKRARLLKAPPGRYIRITLKTGDVVFGQLPFALDSISATEVNIYVSERARVLPINEISDFVVLSPQHQWME